MFDNFQSSAAPLAHYNLKNHHIYQKFGKKIKKGLAQLALNPFRNCTSKTQKTGFQVPDPSSLHIIGLAPVT